MMDGTMDCVQQHQTLGFLQIEESTRDLRLAKQGDFSIVVYLTTDLCM